MTLNRKKLDALRERDFLAYCSELMTPWGTMQEDIHDAFAIIADESAKSPEGLRFFVESYEGDIEKLENVKITVPDWHFRILRHFEGKYGEELGGTIFIKAMAHVTHQFIPEHDPSGSNNA